MKLFNFLYFFCLLFGALFADYDDDRSPLIKEDWKSINQTMSNVHKKCYKFVTPMPQAKEPERSLNYQKAYEWLTWVVDDPDPATFRSYLNSTLANGELCNIWCMFWTSFTGLKFVGRLIISQTIKTFIMVFLYFVLKYVKRANELVSKNVKWIRKFELSIMIPAYMAFFLFAGWVEFFVTAGEAEDALRFGEIRQRDFQAHHSSWVDQKSEQLRCIADEYWAGLESFRHMSGPFFVYRDALMMTDGVFGKYNLGEFVKLYRGLETIPGLKHDDVFYVTYRMMNSIHLKINKSQPWGPDHRVTEFRNLFNQYPLVLNIPTQNQLLIFKIIVTFMTGFTLIVVAGITYTIFTDEVELRDWLLPKLKKAQPFLLLSVIVEAAIFGFLLVQVAGGQAVQKSLTDVNNTFLEGIVSKHGLDLGRLFGEAAKPGKTLMEVYFEERFLFDARADIFVPKVSTTDFAFFDEMFPPRNLSDKIYSGFSGNASSLVNIPKLYRGIANRLHFDTEEGTEQFTAIIFAINYGRHATSMAKDVLVPLCAPIRPLLNMGVYTFMLATWMLFAHCHIKGWQQKAKTK